MNINAPVRLKKQSGFTLVELVIVIALIGILYGISVPNFKGFRAEQKLIQSAQTLQHEVRSASENARSQQKVFGVSIDSSVPSFVRHECEYKDFNQTTNTCSTPGDQVLQDGLPFFEINQVDPDTNFEVYFLPPEGKASDFETGDLPSKSIVFTNKLGQTRTITTYLVTGLTEIYE